MRCYFSIFSRITSCLLNVQHRYQYVNVARCARRNNLPYINREYEYPALESISTLYLQFSPSHLHWRANRLEGEITQKDIKVEAAAVTDEKSPQIEDSIEFVEATEIRTQRHSLTYHQVTEMSLR